MDTDNSIIASYYNEVNFVYYILARCYVVAKVYKVLYM